MLPIVLSGGSGTRLWPVSRESYPKQFAEFFDRSFLMQTISRVRKLGDLNIVTLDSMRAMTERALAEVKLPRSRIVGEPYGKNTAPAVALMVHFMCLENTSIGGEVIGVFPADHLITDEQAFVRAAKAAEALAQKRQAVIFGVRPTSPATGYGYIETGSQIEDGRALQVRRFYEKPDRLLAEQFVADPRFFWNSGIFFFQVDHIRDLFARHTPELWKKISSIKKDRSNLKSVYANVQSQSLDYGIIEKLSDSVVCIPSPFGWSDVGSWDELARLQEENIAIESKASVHTYSSNHNFVYSQNSKVIGLCGVENLIVVDTSDALLVAKRGESQHVRELVASMREAKLPEVTEHRFEVRPWGGFEILIDTTNYKVKRLTIDVGSQLSYQVHMRRDEHWVIVSGKAEIMVDDKRHTYEVGETAVVPRGQKHRIRNAGSDALVIIEVQTGEYFGEDDIVRLKDDYDRI